MRAEQPGGKTRLVRSGAFLTNLVRLPRKTPSKLVTGRRTTRFGAEHGDTGDRGADDEADSFACRECVARGPLACALTLG